MPTSALCFAKLVTERLVLEPFTRHHSAALFTLWSSPAVCQHSGDAHDRDGKLICLPARSPDDSDKILEFFIRRARDGTGVRWAILLQSAPRFVGAVGLNSLEPSVEIAYHLHPDAWGAGYAAEACNAVLAWVGENLIGREIEAYIAPQNDRSIALAKRLGFVATRESEAGARRYVQCGSEITDRAAT